MEKDFLVCTPVQKLLIEVKQHLSMKSATALLLFCFLGQHLWPVSQALKVTSTLEVEEQSKLEEATCSYGLYANSIVEGFVFEMLLLS